jgi:hypothetical protein
VKAPPPTLDRGGVGGGRHACALATTIPEAARNLLTSLMFPQAPNIRAWR